MLLLFSGGLGKKNFKVKGKGGDVFAKTEFLKKGSPLRASLLINFFFRVGV